MNGVFSEKCIYEKRGNERIDELHVQTFSFGNRASFEEYFLG
jgi:hypothetical protein